MLELAFGEIGLSPVVFWYRMSLRDWILTQRGYFNKQERQHKEQWEIARTVSYYSFMSFRGGHLQPEQLIRFPWDEKIKQSEPVAVEDIEYLFRKYGQKFDGENFTN